MLTFSWMSLVGLPSIPWWPLFILTVLGTLIPIGLLATIKDRMVNGSEWGSNDQRRGDSLCERTTVFSDGDDRCARLENVDYEFLDITHVALSTPGWTHTHTHTHYTHTLTVRTYAEGYKQAHTHTSCHRSKWTLQDGCLAFMINAECRCPCRVWETFRVCFYPSLASQPFIHLLFCLQKNILDGAVHSHSVHLIHSTRPSDLREEIKTFQAVTEPVGDQSNLIIRLHPVRAAEDSFYGALGRIHSCCWKCRKTLPELSF